MKVMSLDSLFRLILRALSKIFPRELCPKSSLERYSNEIEGDKHFNPVANVGNGCRELPQDILLDIFSQLEVPDLVRAGSVCSSWHAAYTSLCRTGPHRLHQTPCLLYTSQSSGASALGLYSLAEKKSYTLTLPDPPMRSRHIIGSSYGWIITVDEMCEVHLVNPITCEQIALPSVTTIEQVEHASDDAGSICKYEYSWYTGNMVIASPSIFDPSELRDYLFYKAFLSSDPSTEDFFVVLIHNPQSQLSFARAGDDKWTWLPPHNDYEDCLFQDGYLYASTSSGEIHAFNLAAPAIELQIVLGKMKDYLYERIYIMKAPSGELLQIWRSDVSWRRDVPQGEDEEAESDSHSEPLDDDSYLVKTSNIFVYEVDLSSKELVEKSSLGQTVVFLGRNQSLCLHAEDYSHLKRSHVYFTDDDYLYITCKKNNQRDIGVFDFENNSSQEVAPSPQLWSNSPTPVWLIPNPRKSL